MWWKELILKGEMVENLSMSLSLTLGINEKSGASYKVEDP